MGGLVFSRTWRWPVPVALPKEDPRPLPSSPLAWGSPRHPRPLPARPVPEPGVPFSWICPVPARFGGTAGRPRVGWLQTGPPGPLDSVVGSRHFPQRLRCQC